MRFAFRLVQRSGIRLTDAFLGCKNPNQQLKYLLRLAFASDPEMPNQTLEQLTTDPDPRIRAALGWNQAASGTIFEKLLAEDDKAIQIAVASNPRCPEEILLNLAKSPKSDLRLRVAYNTNAPLQSLLALARDPSMEVREALASNKKIPAIIQEILLVDRSWSVRASLASNDSVCPTILLRLSRDFDSDVRQRCARNARLPKEVRYALLSDRDYLVRGAARGENDELTNPKKFWVETESESAVRRAQCDQISMELATLLSSHEYWEVRLRIAGNPKCPSLLLPKLASDPDSNTQEAAAKNPAMLWEDLI